MMGFRYTYRNLVVRYRSAIPTALAIAASVGAVGVLLSLLQGLTSSFVDSGSPGNAIVLHKGAQSEAESEVPITSVEAIAVMRGVRAVSLEVLTAITIVRAQSLLTVAVRGVDANALRVHAQVKIKKGALPAHGSPGCLVGEKRLGASEALHEGGQIRVGREKWPIVGVLSAPGTQFESELWCDRQALLSALRRAMPSSVVVSLDGPEAFPAFATAVDRVPGSLEAISERDFYRRSTGQISTFLVAIQFVILLLAVGAMLACTNTMYSWTLSRERELATLHAIGFTKRAIAVLVVLESVLLSMIGGTIGVLVTLAVNGHEFTMSQLHIVYTAQATPFVIAETVGCALVIGVGGAIVSCVQAIVRLSPEVLLRG